MAGEGWIDYTWNGQQGWLWDAKVFIPYGVDPTTGPTDAVAVFLAPPNGRAAVQAAAKGDPGEPPDLRNLNVIPLAYNDPAPASGNWSLVKPSVDGSPAIWDATVRLHEGTPGQPTPFKMIAATDLSGAVAAGYYPAYVPGSGGGDPSVVWTAPKVGGQYWPTGVIPNTGASNGQKRTITQVQVPALPFAWRPIVFGYCIINGTANTRPQLVARLGNADTGDIVGSDVSVPGVATQKLSLQAGIPAGSEPGVGRVAKDVGPTNIFLRAEEQASTLENFTTSGTTTWFFVMAEALP